MVALRPPTMCFSDRLMAKTNYTNPSSLPAVIFSFAGLILGLGYYIHAQPHAILSFNIFTARCYACAVLAMGLCLSVCLSQVGPYCY